MDLMDKIQSNYETLKSMADVDYEAYVISLLLLEEMDLDKVTDLPSSVVDAYRKTYSKYMDKDEMTLLNEEFSEMYDTEWDKTLSEMQKTTKTNDKAR